MKSLNKSQKSESTERSLKIKVCAVVLVAFALLIGFVALLGTFTTGELVHYTIEFGDSGSLLQGAPVKIAGVRAGRVDSVDFLIERTKPAAPGLQPVNVRMQISLQERFAPVIREDSEFYITTQGVLGEKYMEIVPGSALKNPLPVGSTIRGTDPPRLDLIMSRGDTILRRIDAALEGTDDLNVTELVVWATRLAKDLDDFLVRNRNALDTLTEDLQATLKETRELVADVRQGIGSGQHLRNWFEEIKASMLNMEGDLSAAMRALLSLAQSMLSDYDAAKKYVVNERENFEQLAKDIVEITTALRAISKDTQGIVSDISQGKGLPGKILRDEVIYDDLKALLRDIKRNPWKMIWRE